MTKFFYFIFLILLTILSPLPAGAKDVFQQYEKVIWIDQENQVAAAYLRGQKLVQFPIVTGDDETPTPPGNYVIKKKDENYYSRTYKTPMPYSLFFDLKGMRAIHEGDLPDLQEKEEWSTHGCIHVEQPLMKWLFDWAEVGKTVVVIRGERLPLFTEGGRIQEKEIKEEPEGYYYLE